MRVTLEAGRLRDGFVASRFTLTAGVDLSGMARSLVKFAPRRATIVKTDDEHLFADAMVSCGLNGKVLANCPIPSREAVIFLLQRRDARKYLEAAEWTCHCGTDREHLML
jgi:hypothetical protein